MERPVYYSKEVDEILCHRHCFPETQRGIAELAHACLDLLVRGSTDEMAAELRAMIDDGEWDED